MFTAIDWRIIQQGNQRYLLFFPSITGLFKIMSRLWFIGFLVFLGLPLAACDPLLSVQGSFWPPWIVCMLTGLLFTAVASQLFSSLKLEPYLGHPLIIYPCLWAVMTFTTWLLGYAY